MIKVIIVDDHNLFRLGLSTAITQNYADIQVVGEADCGEALFELLKVSVPDIILLDICLPDITGVEIARTLRVDYPSLKVLVISAENSQSIVEEMADIGIDGFISKSEATPHDIVVAIHSVMDGFEYFGDDISAILYKIFVAKKVKEETLQLFTEREKEIITLCHQGLLGKQIASRLNISPRTVDNHKGSIFKKLGINSTFEMIKFALQKGIIGV